jgi:hypothetical protein
MTSKFSKELEHECTWYQLKANHDTMLSIPLAINNILNAKRLNYACN